jgi:hypothetical protein
MAHSDLNVDEASKSSRGSDRGDRRSDRSDRGDRRGRDRDDRGGRRESSRGGGDAEVRMFINLGKKDNLRYDEMREMIFQATKVSGHNIKDIDMKGVYSFFQTDEKSADRILSGFQNVEAHGREVRIQKAEGTAEGGGSGSGFRERRESSGGGFKGRREGGFKERRESSGGGYREKREGGSSFAKKKTFTSAESFPAKPSRPKYKKKDDLSW